MSCKHKKEPFIASRNSNYLDLINYCKRSINQSIRWHEQNAVIPCRSQEPPTFLPTIHTIKDTVKYYLLSLRKQKN